MEDNNIKLKELITKLNGKVQKNHPDDLLDGSEIYDICKDMGLTLKYYQDAGNSCKHRWYESNDVIFNVLDENKNSLGYIQSDMVIKLYSEQSCWEDIYCILDFSIVEPYTETIIVTKFRKV